MQTGTRDVGPGVYVPPPLWYAAGLILGWLLERSYPLRFLPRAASRPIAAALILTSACLAATAIVLFLQARTAIIPHKPATALVIRGPFSISRNPMYLGLALLYAGLAFLLQSSWALLLLPVVLAILTRRVIRFEEPYLEAKFGEEYRLYKARVRRWL